MSRRQLTAEELIALVVPKVDRSIGTRRSFACCFCGDPSISAPTKIRVGQLVVVEEELNDLVRLRNISERLVSNDDVLNLEGLSVTYTRRSRIIYARLSSL